MQLLSKTNSLINFIPWTASIAFTNLVNAFTLASVKKSSIMQVLACSGLFWY